MNQSTHDAGVITALLERLEKQRLPRLLALKEKVDGGEPLSDWELEFLGKAVADARGIMPIIDRHPEYHPLATKVLALYKDITEKALQFEEKA